MSTLEVKTDVSILEEFCASRETQNTVPPVKLPEPGCWVARAVYGEDNPRWMLFREWLLNDAPRWFRDLYVRHGQSVARWITPHERVKSVVRHWMDFVIARL